MQHGVKKMIPTRIQDYIQVRGEVSVPELQSAFRLRYADARDIISQLEKRGVLALRDGITYEYALKMDERPIYEVFADDEKDLPLTRGELMSMLNQHCSDGTPMIYVNILRYIIEHNNVDVKNIQRRFATSLLLTKNAVEWCEKKGYISAEPTRKIILTREGFDARYGSGAFDEIPDTDDDDDDDDDD